MRRIKTYKLFENYHNKSYSEKVKDFFKQYNISYFDRSDDSFYLNIDDKKVGTYWVHSIIYDKNSDKFYFLLDSVEYDDDGSKDTGHYEVEYSEEIVEDRITQTDDILSNFIDEMSDIMSIGDLLESIRYQNCDMSIYLIIQNYNKIDFNDIYYNGYDEGIRDKDEVETIGEFIVREHGNIGIDELVEIKEVQEHLFKNEPKMADKIYYDMKLGKIDKKIENEYGHLITGDDLGIY